MTFTDSLKLPSGRHIILILRMVRRTSDHFYKDSLCYLGEMIEEGAAVSLDVREGPAHCVLYPARMVFGRVYLQSHNHKQ